MTSETMQDDWETYLYLRQLERHWRKNSKRMSDTALLKVFPEAKECLPKKIEEWEEVRNKLVDAIKKALTAIKSADCDDFSKWVWREWIKLTDGQKLMEVEGHIKRLKRLLWSTKQRKKHLKDWITEQDKQFARSVPLEEIVETQLRTGGRTLHGLCPLHEERTPSFHIYPEQNRWHCYGCNQGGDVISFIQLKHGLSFIEAVKYLVQN